MEEIYFNRVEIRASAISGKGTFATQKILAGEYIATLSGDTLITTNIDRTCFEKGICIDDPLQIGDTLFLLLNDASKTINHSCKPNTGIKNRSDLYALEDIEIDEEITYDYSTTSGIHDIWVMKCICQSDICREHIGNVLSIPIRMLKFYYLQGALPAYIKNQLELVGFFKFT
jgi:hypothetical protein